MDKGLSGGGGGGGAATLLGRGKKLVAPTGSEHSPLTAAAH